MRECANWRMLEATVSDLGILMLVTMCDTGRPLILGGIFNVNVVVAVDLLDNDEVDELVAGSDDYSKDCSEDGGLDTDLMVVLFGDVEQIPQADTTSVM